MQMSRSVIARKLKSIGLRNVLLCCNDIAKAQFYRLVWGFDSWHASQGFHCRQYKGIAVKMSDDFGPSCVVDVGCGLGDVICRVNAPMRFGIDADERVIRAARSIHKSNISFMQGTIDTVADLSVPRVDILLLLNWLHGCNEINVRRILLDPVRNSIKKKKIRFILFDEHIKHSRYINNKTIHMHILEMFGTIIQSIHDNEGRSLHLIRVESAFH
jgi:hypothetical protein